MKHRVAERKKLRRRYPRKKQGQDLRGRYKRTSSEKMAEDERSFVLAEFVSGTARDLIAARAGISRSTLDRIEADPAFRAELEAARRRRSLADPAR